MADNAKAFDIYQAELKRMRAGKQGMSLKDGARSLKDSAHLAVAASQSRDALKSVTKAICLDPKRAANFKLSSENRDPVLLATVAGPRAMANLSGVAVADGKGSAPTLLEKIAADAAKEHLALAAKNPTLAARREAEWQGQRNVMARGFMAGAMREVSDTYAGPRVARLRGQNGAGSGPVERGIVPELLRDAAHRLNRRPRRGELRREGLHGAERALRPPAGDRGDRGPAAVGRRDGLADALDVARDGLAFRQAFRKFYEASRSTLTRAGNRLGAGIDASISRAGRGRDAVVAGGRAVRDGAAAGGRAVRDGAAAAGRAVRDGAAAGGRAVRDGARAVRDGTARAVKNFDVRNLDPVRGVEAIARGTDWAARKVIGSKNVDRVDQFLDKVDRKVVGLVVGGAAAVRTGVVSPASCAAARVSAAMSRASRLAVVNPVSTSRFKKQLNSHMKQGPEATKSFPLKTLRSASGRSVAMKAGLDPLTIAAASGSRDLEVALSGRSLGAPGGAPGAPTEPARGGRYTTLGLSSPAAAAAPLQADTLRVFADQVRARDLQVETRLPSVVPAGVSVNAVKDRASAGSLQADPEFRALSKDLCARSAGYSGAADRSDMSFADHHDKAVGLNLENQRLKEAGESRDVKDSGHPNHAASAGLDVKLESIMEGGHNAKLVKEINVAQFDQSRPAAVAVLDDDWAGDRGGSGLQPVSGEDQRSYTPSRLARQFAAERIADLRLDLSPAAQADARENGLASVKPRNAADRVVLRDIEICRDTIHDYERGQGSPDHVRVPRPLRAAAAAPSQAPPDARTAAPAPVSTRSSACFFGCFMISSSLRSAAAFDADFASCAHFVFGAERWRGSGCAIDELVVVAGAAGEVKGAASASLTDRTFPPVCGGVTAGRRGVPFLTRPRGSCRAAFGTRPAARARGDRVRRRAPPFGLVIDDGLQERPEHPLAELVVVRRGEDVDGGGVRLGLVGAECRGPPGLRPVRHPARVPGPHDAVSAVLDSLGGGHARERGLEWHHPPVDRALGLPQSPAAALVVHPDEGPPQR